MQRPKPITNEIYHVYNRGVDKRDVFLNEDDYFRFIHDLFEFNDIAPTLNLAYHLGRSSSKEVGLPKMGREPRKLLVELLVFCLMPNHIHLLITQKRENGITEFMRKLGTGYTNYFNQKYNRSGALFQGKYKLVHIANNPHFIHIPHYIHMNPLDLKFLEWRSGEIRNYKEAMKFLETYRWSSLPDYIGKTNFPSLTSREFLSKFWEGSGNYKRNLVGWLKEIDLNAIKGSTLE